MGDSLKHERYNYTSETSNMKSFFKDLIGFKIMHFKQSMVHYLTFKSVTSHRPSIQTLEVSCEQVVPSLTLLARAKKKS